MISWRWLSCYFAFIVLARCQADSIKCSCLNLELIICPFISKIIFIIIIYFSFIIKGFWPLLDFGEIGEIGEIHEHIGHIQILATLGLWGHWGDWRHSSGHWAHSDLATLGLWVNWGDWRDL